eukprot:m.93936 g.93936  ORF g.93936 m.93936 type:complete len:222 (-) comp14712_c2_seq8:1114-1779(-)
MVPGLLSSNLCSLRGGEERFAFSCMWELTPQAEIVRTEFTKSIIRSRVAMMYSEAQMRIDDQSDTSSLTEGLRVLNSLAKKLRRRRIERGALMLASTEVRFSMDETNDPVDMKIKEQYDTNSLVEEFMLLANVSTAEHIFQHFTQCAVLRRHPAPPPSNFEPLLKAVGHYPFFRRFNIMALQFKGAVQVNDVNVSFFFSTLAFLKKKAKTLFCFILFLGGP